MRTEKVSKDRWRVFARKAAEFASTMEVAAGRKEWQSAGLAAVHCVISACDALTVFHLGERSRGESHAEAAELVSRTKVEEAGLRADQARSVIAIKNLVEYEARLLGKGEAEAAVRKAKKVLAWVMDQLPEDED